VSPRASALAQADFAHGQIEIIVYYQEVAPSNVILTHQASHGVPTEIHKCPGLGQQHFLTPYFANAYSSSALPVVKANGMKLAKVIQAPETNIMAIVSISLAGVAQTNDEFHSLKVYGNSYDLPPA
jgi:hypothetical protein